MQHRGVALTVAGTQLCARVGEMKRLQVCDFLLNYDLMYSTRYRGQPRCALGKGSRIGNAKDCYQG
jgi:hypothetical protein